MRITPKQVLAVCLAACAAGVHADENRIQKRLARVYDQGGHTLYCHEHFDNAGDVSFNRIYGIQAMLNAMGCLTRSQCQDKKRFRQAMSSLHNIYPVKPLIKLAQRNTHFGPLGKRIPVASEACPYQVSYQTFDPPEYAQGNVARALLYMHHRFDLPLHGSLDTYLRWNREDPPDAAERARNQAIAHITGQRNPFIDKPEQAKRMVSR